MIREPVNRAGAPAASAASVETPATGTSSANASARAAARPIRRPVKLPGPVPTTTSVSSEGAAPLSRKSWSASSSTRTARETRSPSSSPSRTSAVVVALVAVSNASVSTSEQPVEQDDVRAFQRDEPMSGIHVRQTYLHAHGRERADRGLGPLDEADRVFEVRFEVAPLRRRQALEAEEIEVRDVRVGRVAVPDREGRARHRRRDPERAAGAPNERGLAATELAGDGDHVTGAQRGRQVRGDRLRIRRRGGAHLHGLEELVSG